MTPERFRQIEELYHAACESSPEGRAVLLAQSDPELRREVEALLTMRHAGEFLDRHVLQNIPRLLDDSTSATLEAGAQLGPYRIEGKIGEGGMGEVFRAIDTRLGRAVAIKVTYERFNERFTREARAISSLNHPNICSLYDVGHQDGLDFLVMEYLEGQTLADRLSKGALSPPETLRLAIEIASALDQAHRRGITHRDLKPGNVMLTRSGVKLLDFGLAKTQKVPSGVADVTNTTPLTREGSILGTLPYMAPEQLEGKEADSRSDVFAFGSVVYEMVAGRRVFQGDTQASLTAAIMNQDPPPLASLPSVVGKPEGIALDRVVRTCLKKDPEQRWQTAGELLHTLKWITEEPTPKAIPARSAKLPWALAVLSLVALAVVAFASGWLKKASPVTRFAILSPEGTAPPLNPNALALSPDGRSLALIETDTAGRNSLWIRQLGAASAQRVEHTEGANYPFWSPDGQFVAFNVRGKLNKIPVAGGTIQTICEDCFGNSWGAGDVILGSSNNGSVVYKVPANGGDRAAVTTLDEAGGETGHFGPQFLPDGKHFLYHAGNKTPSKSGIYVQELGSSQRTFVMKTLWRAAFAPPGYLLFVRDGALFAQSLNMRSYQLNGAPTLVADNVAIGATPWQPGTPLFTVTESALACRSSRELTNRQLVWYSRDGKRLQEVGQPGWHAYVKLSPDERRVAVARHQDGFYPDIWLMDLGSAILSRLTFDPWIQHIDPTWSSDSRRLVIAANLDAKWELRELAVTSGASTVLYTQSDPMYLDDWSPDGKSLVYHNNVGGGTSVYLLPLTEERKPQLLLKSSFTIDQCHLSPDGRWLAYSSNESRRYEIYVASFPALTDRRRVSPEGGVQPVWRNDGKELTYLSFQGDVMAAEVNLRPTLNVGTPRPLFQTNVNPFFAWDFFAPTKDGKKFLVIESPKKSVGEVNVVLNWDTALPH